MVGSPHLRRAPAVIPVEEQFGTLPAQLQGRRRHPQLRVIARVQGGPARRVIDRPAIVGVDEAVVPQFGALVYVWHTRGGELNQLLAQGVAVTMSVKPGDESGQLDRDGSVDDGVKPRVDRAFEPSSGSFHVVCTPASRMAFSA